MVSNYKMGKKLVQSRFKSNNRLVHAMIANDAIINNTKGIRRIN